VLIANVPARTLFDGVHWSDLAGLAAATVILCALSRAVFSGRVAALRQCVVVM